MNDQITTGSPAEPKLSRVVLAYHPENFDRAVADFTAAFGLSLELLDTRHLGLRVAISLAAGIEVIAPDGNDGYAPIVREELSRRGEGLQQIILEVPDLEDGVAVAKAAGWDPGSFRIDCFDANPAWRESYLRMREAPLPPISDVSVTLIEKVPHA